MFAAKVQSKYKLTFSTCELTLTAHRIVFVPHRLKFEFSNSSHKCGFSEILKRGSLAHNRIVFPALIRATEKFEKNAKFQWLKSVKAELGVFELFLPEYLLSSSKMDTFFSVISRLQFVYDRPFSGYRFENSDLSFL